MPVDLAEFVSAGEIRASHPLYRAAVTWLTDADGADARVGTLTGRSSSIRHRQAPLLSFMAAMV